jgi:short-subunit dehydrogenase
MCKIIVIVGGSGGVGKRLAGYFSEHGDDVFSLSRSNKKGFNNHIYCDVTDETSVKKAIDEVGTNYGRIDTLILCNGIGMGGDLENSPVDKIKYVFDVNYFGCVSCVQAALKYMPNNSRIAVIGSAAAFFALPYRSVYSASKAALNVFSAALDMELRKKGIRAVSICPGEIDNEFVANRLWAESGENDDKLKSLKKRLKNKKRMDPDKAAEKIFSVINKKRVRPLYIIGFKYKFFYVLSKLLPVSAMHKLIYKMYG